MHTRFRASPQTAAITEHFYAWDYRLRGYDLWQYPVHPEPVYTPFFDVRTPQTPITDDARQHTALSGLVKFVKDSFSPKEPAPSIDHDEEENDLSPDLYVPDGERKEFQIALPKDAEYSPQVVISFLASLKGLHHPLTFELIGTSTHVLTQFSCMESDASFFESQFTAFFPKAVVTKQQNHLSQAWYATGSNAVSIVDFGLSEECGLSIQSGGNSFSPDPFISLIATLETVSADECAVLQIIFTPTVHDWRTELMDAITDGDGSCVFSDAPELLSATREKAKSPLFAVVVRAGVVAIDKELAHAEVQRIGSALGQFDSPGGNKLIPLTNDYYPDEVHEDDLLLRMTHRSGMLLSTPELIGLVHLPTTVVASTKLLRADARTKECPRSVYGHNLVLGTNTHQGIERTVTLSQEQRMRHTYIVGASGTGKSNLLLNLITQDIENGEGIALLDPHGDLTEAVLTRIPPERSNDVIVFDPSDEDFPIGFNIFHAHSEAEKTLLASDLTKTFQRLSTSWGDRMNAILANGILAMLEHPEGGTLLTLRRFLTDKAYRREFLTNITDQEIRYYWEKEYPLLSGKAEAPVLTRLDTFLRTKIIRNMVAQAKNSIDLSKVMDEKKILLVKLSHGAIGEENAHLLGTLIVTAIHQASLRRQSINKENRTPFYLYVDEFQNFITPSMESILSGARKYNLGLILAHQERRQLLSKDKEVASSVLSNPYTRICFRLGYDDASTLAKGLSFFDSSDLQNLGIGQAIVRTEQAQYDFNLAVPWKEPSESNRSLVQEIITKSQTTYGIPKEEVEASLHQFYSAQYSTQGAPRSTFADTESTKPTETPRPRSESAPVQPPEQPKAEPAVKTKTPGRGGSQHTYLQNLIKKYAEEKGFGATLEEEILAGSGYVDVSLTLGETKIACEISVTNSVAYEVENIQKCLAAGYDHVVLVCHQKSKLAKLQVQARTQLERSVYETVFFLEPDGFLAFLDELVAKDQGRTKTIRGYTVSTNYVAGDAADSKAKSAAVAKLIAQTMRKK